MKICPYCKEEVHDQAIKCRYCSSSLLPPQAGTENRVETPPPGPDRAVYILDLSLVRFAKFAVALLAIFVTIGVFLWGFDIKQAAKEVGDSVKEVRSAADEVRRLQFEARNTNDEIKLTKDEMTKNLRTSSQQLEEATKTAAANKGRIQDLEQQFNDVVKRASQDQQRLHARVETAVGGSSPQDTSATTTATHKNPGFSVPELAELYNFPTEFGGQGQSIGLIELGGGYRDSDLNTYFERLKIPKPKVTWVSVGGAKNTPSGDPYGSDAQVTMGIEIAGAAAPAAHIVVYFAHNTRQGFLDAVNAAIDDKTNHPSILSISWGSDETAWSKSEMMAMDQAFQRAALSGLTVIVSASDLGVTDGVTDGQRHVDFPTSSPWVLSCGGSRLTAAGNKISSEVVWNDGTSATGGGVSDIFQLPDWQGKANVPPRKDGNAGRGIPDVVASASPASGYRLYIHGQSQMVGGTSGSAPLWAGLIARMNQGLGRNIGYINPVLYSKLGPAGVLRSITEGNNGMNGVKGYSAGPGWTPATGWGSPDGKRLLEAFFQETKARK